MGWYKIHARFGPGHMGKDTSYQWVNGILDEDGERELAEMMFEKHAYSEQVKVDVNPVDAIPEGVRDEMVREYEGQIRGANYMLGILNNPTKTPVRD